MAKSLNMHEITEMHLVPASASLFRWKPYRCQSYLIYFTQLWGYQVDYADLHSWRWVSNQNTKAYKQEQSLAGFSFWLWMILVRWVPQVKKACRNGWLSSSTVANCSIFACAASSTKRTLKDGIMSQATGDSEVSVSGLLITKGWTYLVCLPVCLCSSTLLVCFSLRPCVIFSANTIWFLMFGLLWNERRYESICYYSLPLIFAQKLVLSDL